MPDNRHPVPVSLPAPNVVPSPAQMVRPLSISQPQHEWGALTVPMVDNVNPLQYLADKPAQQLPTMTVPLIAIR